jgi:hypothetical protein
MSGVMPLNGPRDRLEVELGFIAAKAEALRAGYLAWGDPTTLAPVPEQRAAVEAMAEAVARVLGNPLLAVPEEEPEELKPQVTEGARKKSRKSSR